MDCVTSKLNGAPEPNYMTAIVPLSKQPARGSQRRSFISYIFWPLVFCVNLYDFLGLCHLVPTHTLHLSRPFMMTTLPFNVFNKPRPNYDEQ